MAEQEGAEVLGRLHAEVRQVHGELRALRAELQQLQGVLQETRAAVHHVASASAALHEGQRALQGQGALQADALRLVAGVVQRLADMLRECPGKAGAGP